MFHVLLLLSLTVSSLASPLIGNETADVRPASENEFLFIVSIGLATSGYQHFCTGSLITRSHVLTAAHCFKSFGRLRNYRVLVGTNDLNNPKNQGEKHRLSSDGWLRYDDWARKTNNTHLSPYRWNDIAIITLMSVVDERIRLSKFSHLTVDQLYGRTVVAAGWGHMKDNAKVNLLQKTELRVMNSTECKDNMEDLGYKREDVHDNELCSKADSQVILGFGDSGGPLLINGNVIVGVNEGICPADTEPIPPKAFNIHMSMTGYYRKFIESVTHLCL